MEDRTGDWRKTGEDVTSRGMIFASLNATNNREQGSTYKLDAKKDPYLRTCSELTIREEQVDIIRTNKVLRKIDNSSRQTGFAVMVFRLFTNVTDKLLDL